MCIKGGFMSKHNFKVSTFLSGLFMILISIAFLGVGLLFVMQVIPAFSSDDGLKQLGLLFAGIIVMPFIILVLILIVIMFFCYLVLGIMLIVSSFKTDDAFHRWRGFVIFTIVIDFLMILPLFWIGCGINGFGMYICIGTSIALLLSAILKIVDLSLSGKRLKKAQQLAAQKAQETQTQDSQNVDFSKLSNENSEGDAPEIVVEESEIDKLNKLKENGLITDEEYEKQVKELKGEDK